MVGGHHGTRNCIKGRSVRKVKNHWLRSREQPSSSPCDILRAWLTSNISEFEMNEFKLYLFSFDNRLGKGGNLSICSDQMLQKYLYGASWADRPKTRVRPALWDLGRKLHTDTGPEGYAWTKHNAAKWQKNKKSSCTSSLFLLDTSASMGNMMWLHYKSRVEKEKKKEREPLA